MKIKSTYTPYKGYFIEYNFYGKNEYTVQADGDDVWFMTKKDAMKFIDDIVKEKENENGN